MRSIKKIAIWGSLLAGLYTMPVQAQVITPPPPDSSNTLPDTGG